jgi:hypothetical protein
MDIEEVHKKTPVWGNVAPKLLVKEKPGDWAGSCSEFWLCGSWNSKA